MASTIKIDGWDIYPYTRVAPGEGFEPLDTLTDPQFSNPALGEGQPLINFTTKNREVVIPVHLKPEWSHGSYASTRDGLNNLLIEMNRTLKSAQRFEWKDEGVATSTFYDVQFARFEPEYNYRRAGVRVLSGNIHLWTSPYGDTNAERLVASGIGSGPVFALPIASLMGDISPNLNINIKVGGTTPISNYQRDGRIVGYAVVPSGYVVEHPPASLMAGYPSFWPGYNGLFTNTAATVTIATDAIGSVMLRTSAAQNNGVSSLVTGIGQLQLSNASIYQGRQRVFAIVRNGRHVPAPLAALYNGKPLYPDREAVASMLGAWEGWSTVDLGVADIDRTNATALITLVNYSIPSAPRDSTLFDYHISRIVTVPEERCSLVFDANREVLGRLSCNSLNSRLTIDNLGNPIVNGSVVASYPLTVDGDVSGFVKLMRASGLGGSAYAGATFTTGGAMVQHRAVKDLQVRAVGIHHEGVTVNSSAAFDIGHTSPSSNVLPGIYIEHFARYFRTPTQHVLSLINATPWGLVASIAIAATVTLAPGVIEFEMKGPYVFANMRLGSSYLATLAGTTPYVGYAGWGFVRIAGSVGTTQWGNDFEVLSEVTFSTAPSHAINLGDQYQWTATTTSKTASVGKSFVDTLARGPIVKPNPGKYEQFVALNLPLDGGGDADFLTVDVRALERFTFSQ